MISGSAAVRRELEKYELAQISIRIPEDEALSDVQWDLMRKLTGTNSIPLHVVFDHEGNALSRIDYDPIPNPESYLAFLAEGMAKFRAGK